MSMFRHGLKEEIRDELGNMEFSSLEELIESALEAGELFVTSSNTSDEAIPEMDPDLRDIFGFSDGND